MPLYSSDTFSEVIEDNLGNESASSGAEERKQSDVKSTSSSWCYLFVHRAKVEAIHARLQEQFNTFIHKSIVYRKKKSHVRKLEQPTISGLIFVQGDCRRIQEYLKQNFVGVYLVNDRSTHRTAIISDREMQPFMLVSQMAPHRIRFMPHPFSHYAPGNTLVRITSGVLAGFEGYRIRISRDKCLVTGLGNMTVAIGGICKDTFENVEEYIRQRREQQDEPSPLTTADLQQEVDACCFCPHDQLDLMTIAKSLDQWVMKARYWMLADDYREAAEALLGILSAVGRHFRTVYGDVRVGSFKEVTSVCREADNMLLSMVAADGLAEDLHQHILTSRRSLAADYPFLPMHS